MFLLVHGYCICYPKKFRAIIGRNYISVHDTGSVKYRVYSIKCTPEQERVSTGVYENLYIQPLVRSPEKHRDSRPVNWKMNCDVITRICWRFKCIRACTYKARLTVYLDSRVHLGRRDFSSLYVTTHILCVFGLGKKHNNIWLNNQIIHTFKNKIMIFFFL